MLCRVEEECQDQENCCSCHKYDLLAQIFIKYKLEWQQNHVLPSQKVMIIMYEPRLQLLQHHISVHMSQSVSFILNFFNRSTLSAWQLSRTSKWVTMCRVLMKFQPRHRFEPAFTARVGALNAASTECPLFELCGRDYIWHVRTARVTNCKFQTISKHTNSE